MKITFKQIDEQHVNIMCGDKRIGHIFSPAGSANSITNAVQVCGFEDAYDLWGCGVFSEKFVTEIPYTDKQLKMAYQSIDPYIKGRTFMTKSEVKHKKDIQLLFKEYDNIKFDQNDVGECYRCFDKECSCESQERNTRITIKDSFNEGFKKKLNDTGFPDENDKF